MEHTVKCILCDKQTPVSKSVEDCETGHSICYECNGIEFDNWNAEQAEAKFKRLTKRLATVLEELYLLTAMNDAPIEVTALFGEEGAISHLVSKTLKAHRTELIG